MTPIEYVQLRAFARQDGALLSLLWIGSFACYIQGLTYPSLGMAAILLAIMSPFFAANRLRHFRDYAREGFITFKRGYAYTVMSYFYAGLLGYAYTVMSYFYAGLLLAVAIYVYFEYMDNGYLLGVLSSVMASEEGKKVLELYGMKDQMQQEMQALYDMRPIDFAVNMLTISIMAGFFLGLPIAALMRREGEASEEVNSEQ